MGTQPGMVGKDVLPPASWHPEKTPGESRAPMLRRTNAGCRGGGGEVAGLRRDAGKLCSQRSCSNEKMNQPSYGVDLVLEYEE